MTTPKLPRSRRDYAEVTRAALAAARHAASQGLASYAATAVGGRYWSTKTTYRGLRATVDVRHRNSGAHYAGYRFDREQLAA